MIQQVTFFENPEDLERMIGLTHDQLWEAGFNLDDMDFGIVTEKEWNQDGWDDDDPYYESWLLYRMDAHCVGYTHTEYDGKHYYTLHHS